MTDTKQKILGYALLLFNEKGIENITVRDIAKKMGISHGNLCYHYPTTNDIAYALYQKLVADLDQRISSIPEEDVIMQELISSSRYAIEKFYEYRFLMLDFVSVMRKNIKMATHYKNLELYRNKQFKDVFARLRQYGIVRSEQILGEYDNVINIWFILGDFWMAHAEINFEGTKEEKIGHYSRLIFSLLVPFLTEKGMKMLVDYQTKNSASFGWP